MHHDQYDQLHRFANPMEGYTSRWRIGNKGSNILQVSIDKMCFVGIGFLCQVILCITNWSSVDFIGFESLY